MNRLLIIGISRSPHLQKWVECIPPIFSEINFIESTNQRADISCFKTMMPLKVIELKFETLRKESFIYRLINFLLEKFLHQLYISLQNDISTLRLLKALRLSNFDLIHCFEIQHAGYALERILNTRNYEKNIRLYVSVWGSDIYWFMNNHFHRPKIERLLQNTDVLILDSDRDIPLAKSLGFQKRIYRVNSHAGGIKTNEFITLNSFENIKRNSILVKGHFGFVGRPFFALDILTQLAPLLLELELELNFLPLNESLKPMFASQLDNFGLKYNLFDFYELDRSDILKLMRRSKICLANSVSDGLPTTAIECMASGCVPIQSNTSTLIEWGVDKRLILPSLDGNTWIKLIRELLNDDLLLRNIAFENLQIAMRNFNSETIQGQIEQLYRSER
jgi:glycosyltransferase involved in cell wall biosynthesis